MILEGTPAYLAYGAKSLREVVESVLSPDLR